MATGSQAEFGRIAMGLGQGQPETEFQAGLRKFSMLLVQVAAVLTTAIFIINVALHKPVMSALLFSLAIAVGITPQLLPAVVSASLAAGSRQLARSKVLVKRLVCIEDLGDIDVLFTDKTGTLTEGSLRFMRSTGPDGTADDEPLLLGLLCNEAVVENGRAAGGNALDVALWDSPAAAGQQAALARYRRLGTVPFDHERRLVSVLTEDDHGNRMIITKGAPEGLLKRCTAIPAAARMALEAEFAAGNRVIAVATREMPGVSSITAADEHDLTFRGILVFLDPPKPTAKAALQRLASLGVTVKILTGDNPVVAAKVCADLGLPPGQVATGADIDAAGDQLDALLARTTVFARVSPEHKAQIVRAQRATGTDVAFLGDGVNNAVALQAADVGISVDSATDVAKDAADVLLLEKDLDVLTDGVTGGRRIFANTIKYVLMGTSSNFGNMFSAAGAFPVLPQRGGAAIPQHGDVAVLDAHLPLIRPALFHDASWQPRPRRPVTVFFLPGAGVADLDPVVVGEPAVVVVVVVCHRVPPCLYRVRRTAGQMSLDLLGLALADAQGALDLPKRGDVAGPGSREGPPGRVQQAARGGVAAASQLIGCIRCRIRRCGPCLRVHPGVAPHPGEQFHAADVGGHWPHRQQRTGNARVEPVADVRGDRGADPGQQHDPGQHRHVPALPGGDQHRRRRGGDQPVTGQRQQRGRGDGLPVVAGEGVDVGVGVAAGE